jgi:glycosyl transferase family 25
MIPENHPSPQPVLAAGTLLINLDQRPERLERFEGLPHVRSHFPGWKRLPGVSGIRIPGYGGAPWFRGRKRDTAWAGRAGCVLSHRKAIETALNAGWSRVCILEDDIDLPGDSPAALEAAASWLDGHEDLWEIAYLGFTEPVGPCMKLTGHGARLSVYRIGGCATTHAYILKRKAMEWIITQLPGENGIWDWIAEHRAIDRWYSRNLAGRFPVVAFSPSIIGQVSDFSDIGQREADDEREESFYMAIPDRLVAKSPIAFSARFALRKAQVGLMNACDKLRALRKRNKGF